MSTRIVDEIAEIIARINHDEGMASPDAERSAIKRAQAIADEFHGQRIMFWSDALQRQREERNAAIRRARAKGLTVREVAAVFGVSKSLVSDIDG